MSELSQKGQSTLEYVLVIAVVFALFQALTSSALFQEFLGDQGRPMQTMAETIRVHYQYGGVEQGARLGDYQRYQSSYTNQHPSFYWQTQVGLGTRFFVPIEGYEDTP